MKKKLFTAGLLSVLALGFTGCYNNKSDILELPKVSFRTEIVPIMTSGACGCHNNGVVTRAVQFSYLNNIYYDAILARVGVYDAWVNGTGKHPAEGTIDFTPGEKSIIKRWISEGAKDDFIPPPITGNVTFTANILPIYNVSCKGSSCHGGAGPNLDYAGFVADKSIITAMVNSGGSTGHPGGAVSLTLSTIATIQAWLDQGMPQ